MLPLQGAQVQCLVKELTSYMLSSVAKNLKKKKSRTLVRKKKDKNKKKVRWGREEPCWRNTKSDLASMWDGSRKSETESKNNLYFSCG